jgi:hypothetical protein
MKASKKVTAIVNEVKAVKEIRIPQLSKRLSTKLDKIEKFDSEKANNFSKLLHVSNLTEIDTFGLNKVLKLYLEKASEVLSKGQIETITFANVVNYIQTSKYKDLKLFSFHQITLICNSVIKENHKATRQAERAIKQGAKVVSNVSAPKGKGIKKVDPIVKVVEKIPTTKSKALTA